MSYLNDKQTSTAERPAPKIIMESSHLCSHINEIELRLRSLTIRTLGHYRPPENKLQSLAGQGEAKRETTMDQFQQNIDTVHASINEMELMISALEQQF